ncbi:hypothetical protein [Actinomadura rupiterrae]|uniref:hypothetical protein n=1 Tax=Actinomadura rupiterrae TaxID=559627 RepID=UPI0020A3C73D|nr:hypothetical protein [Actinomadura rupiterrae]MCP2338823.1 hypothetical protein [Actinomadura rupiterrae]
MTATPRPRRGALARRALAVALGAALLQALMITAFAWPSARIAPREVPIVVAGPGADAVASRLDHERPGMFDVKVRTDEASARKALTDREAYGAIVTAPAGPHVLVASAASPVLAQQLGQLAAALPKPGGAADAPGHAAPPAAVQDVVPAAHDDPRGTGFGAMVLPLVMSAIVGAVLLTMIVQSVLWRFVGVVVFAVFGGLAVGWLARYGLSLLPGSYLEIAGVAGLGVLACTAAVAGLAAVLGRPGLGLGGLTMMLIGNPLSAATSAPELLPRPWGEIGQYLPPGAAATLLRNTAFFDGAQMTRPLAVLLAWGLGGLVLLALGSLRGRRSPAPATVTDREPALA